MVALDITETSKSLAVAGGYVTIVGLVSYLVKEKLFVSEALLAVAAGIIFGPISLGWFDPSGWSSDLNYLTYQLARIVIAIQVLFTGIALPRAYLWKERSSLLTLLGPVMLCAWFVTGLLIWGLIPGLSYLEALIISACVTPTDPVLANSICKGRFAEKHVPLHVRNVILAESGANDGLGFPFLYIGLYLVLVHEPSHPWHSTGGAVLEWFYNIVLYQVVLSCILGAIIGYIARKVLRFAEERDLIDHESFLSFGIALTFFTLGTVGILGSDDILCCFIVGNSFTWDDWFRVQTEDHAFQDVIDQLLSTGIFLYFGSIIPWGEFGEFSIHPWRLAVLGICVMLVRRVPWVVALAHFIPTLPTWRESIFAGFFGPIGVGAIFYTQVALATLPEDGTRTHLRDVILPVNYFIVLTSVIVHGTTIPLGKGFQLARSITLTRSQNNTGPNVSRLPAPVPFGSDALQEREAEDRSEESTPTDPSQSIRFKLNGDGENGKKHSPTSQQDGKPQNGIISSPGSRAGSGRGTPSGPGSPSRNPGTDSDDRETPSGMIRGKTWREGDKIVVESENGERIVVHPME